MDDSIAQLLSLDGKVALVTGAATGIGESIAGVLAAAGAHVVVTDIDADGAGEGGRGHRRARPPRRRGPPRRHRRGVGPVRHRGRPSSAVVGLDVLVNNAGSFHDSGSIVDQTYESWRRAIAINYEGVFLCSKPAAEHMVARGEGGAIVTISSVDGIVPCLGTGYDSAKAALFQFTRSLAVDLAPFGIRANCVAPGNVPVETIRRMKAGELPQLWDEPSVPTGLMGPMATSRSANIPLGPQGTARGDLPRRPVPVQRRRVVRHRPDAGRRRRLDPGLIRRRRRTHERFVGRREGHHRPHHRLHLGARHRSFDDLRQVFAPDAVGDLGGRHCEGIDAIIARIQEPLTSSTSRSTS